MAAYAFGVDVGGTTTKLGLFELDLKEGKGNLLEKWERPTRLEGDGKYILEDIANSIENEIREKELPADEILGVGLAVPGPVRADGIVNRCVNLGWGVKNVSAALSELLCYPVYVANDATTAACGEVWMGAAGGYGSAVLVTLGTGVGGGIVHEGRPVFGAFGAGGEIGHMTVNRAERETCGCGRKGCLEQYASAKGIAHRMENKIAEWSDDPAYAELFPTVLSSKIGAITAKDVFEAAAQGDALAKAHIEETMRILAFGLSQVASVVDPEIFVIGGGVSKAGDILVDLLKKYYSEMAFHASKEAEFALAMLGNDAGIYGCAQMVLEHALAE